MKDYYKKFGNSKIALPVSSARSQMDIMASKNHPKPFASRYSFKFFDKKSNKFKDLQRLGINPTPVADYEDYCAESIISFIKNKNFPCVGAPGTIIKNQVRYLIYESYDDALYENQIQLDLIEFINEYKSLDTDKGNDLTLLVIFKDETFSSIGEADLKFWSIWQEIADYYYTNYGWPEGYSTNPKDKNFTLSIGLDAIFVNYSHPCAKYVDRRFPFTTFVINPQRQFDYLREINLYKKFKKFTRERQQKLGFINAYQGEIGEVSQANVMTSSDTQPVFEISDCINGNYLESKCPFKQVKRKVSNFLNILF
ncbi:MAG: hypothetical protein Aureis2KO_05480 [Aureisphaera sp.]